VDTDAERVQHEVEHIRGKDNVVADTQSRFPPDVDAAVTKSVDLPIVGATLTSEKQFITALFMSSGLDELKPHFRNLRQLQLNDPFLGSILRTRIQGYEPEAHLRQFRIHQDILIFFHPSDGLPKIALPEILMESVTSTNNMVISGFRKSIRLCIDISTPGNCASRSDYSSDPAMFAKNVNFPTERSQERCTPLSPNNRASYSQWITMVPCRRAAPGLATFWW
jgi:hypothetical protein